MLSKLQKIMSITNLLGIMYGIYFSIATHGIIVWSTPFDIHLNSLSILHKNIFKALKAAGISEEKMPLSLRYNKYWKM